MKKSIASYEEKKKKLVRQYKGAEFAINSLENVIEKYPTACRADKIFNGYINYLKTTYVKIYDTFMHEKDEITIHYLVHGDTIILLDIY